MSRVPFVTPMIEKVAAEMGATVIIEPEYRFVGQIVFPSGAKVFFRNTTFDINRLGSVEISRDKKYSSFFLARAGHRVPEEQSFFSDELCKHIEIKRDIHDGCAYAEKLGFPVFLKPNNLSQGELVTKVHDRREYYATARRIFRRTSVMLVQRVHPGNDFRIVVLDDQVISAYRRIPLHVVGDGASSISTLLARKQLSFRASGRDTIIDREDPRIRAKLRRAGLKLSSVPERGGRVVLLDNANLSTGGDGIDLTESIHPDYAALAVNVTRDMCLRLCGVDVLTEDITRPLGEHVVLEINGAPGLDNYASIGPAQEARVQAMYRAILEALSRETPLRRTLVPTSAPTPDGHAMYNNP